MGNPLGRRSAGISRRRLGVAALGLAVTACARRVPSATSTSKPRPSPLTTVTQPPQQPTSDPSPTAPTTPAVATTTAVAGTTGTPARATTATPENNSPYGASFGSNELDERSIPAIDLAGRAGLGWLRLTFFWNRIEPTRGHLDWSGYDALLAKASSAGISVLGLIGFVADWATSAPITVLRPAFREHYPPASYAVWQRYVETLVGRYKDQIHCWEVWNEPDLQLYWGGTPAQYAQLLALTYTTIKRISPDATVLLGGLSLGGSPGNLDKNFFPKILNDPRYPALKYFDVANFHAYGTAAEIGGRLNYVRSQLAGAGGSDRPIWITEIGYPSSPQAQTTHGFQDGPASQAKWLVEALTRLRQAGVARLFWFQLYDLNPPAQVATDVFVTDGLLDYRLNPKPALQAYQRLITTAR